MDFCFETEPEREKEVIEFVDEINGQSKLAEAFANQFSTEHDLDLVVSSSGIYTGLVASEGLGLQACHDMPFLRFVKHLFCQIYLQESDLWLNETEREELYDIVSKEGCDVNRIYDHYRRSILVFTKIQDSHLAKVAQNMGLKDFNTEPRAQTKREDNLTIFCGFSEPSIDFGINIYRNSNDVLFHNLGVSNENSSYDLFLMRVHEMKAAVEEFLTKRYL